jgi:hypothetical protein
MPTRTWSDPNSKYKYGFNEQEKENEIAGDGNINTAMFWEYDTRTGRRWNLDPKPQTSLSDYSVFNNNPIVNSDLLGDEFAPGKSRREAKDYHKFLKRREKNISKEIKNIEKYRMKILDKLSKNPTSKKWLEKEAKYFGQEINNKYAEKVNSLAEVKNAISEYAIIKSSPVVITFESDNQPRTLKTSDGNLTVRWSDWAEMAHELKHVFQYLNGQNNFNPNGTAGPLYDVTDEVEAFRREYALMPTHFKWGTRQFNNTTSLNQITVNWVLAVNYGQYVSSPF